MALLDGSLILWGLGSKDYPDFVIEALLENGMLHYLRRNEKLNRTANCPWPAISAFPAAMMWLMPCGCPCVRTILWTPTIARIVKPRNCEKIAGIQDRDLFDEDLKEGQKVIAVY